MGFKELNKEIARQLKEAESYTPGSDTAGMITTDIAKLAKAAGDAGKIEVEERKLEIEHEKNLAQAELDKGELDFKDKNLEFEKQKWADQCEIEHRKLDVEERKLDVTESEGSANRELAREQMVSNEKIAFMRIIETGIDTAGKLVVTGVETGSKYGLLKAFARFTNDPNSVFPDKNLFSLFTKLFGK